MQNRRHFVRMVALAFVFVMPGIALSTGETKPEGTQPVRAFDKLTYEDACLLMDEGVKLTAEQVAEFGTRLQQDPKDLAARLRLLRRESGREAMSPAGVELMMGLIENHPRSLVAGPICIAFSAFEREACLQGIALWEKLVDANPDEARILGNAAMWMEHFGTFNPEYRARAKDLFERAHTLDPQNPEWLEHLGYAHLLEAGYPRYPDGNHQLAPNARVAAARKGVEQYEAARHLRGEVGREMYRPIGQNYLAILAEASLLEGETNLAQAFARELLEALDKNVETWNYGNLIHRYNVFLGKIALQEGKTDEAAKCLIAAGKTPGSPQLNSFGPSMVLAKELLEKGEKDVVLQYFDLCAKFWKSDQDPRFGGRLEKWKAQVEKGEMPDFGPNLRY